MLGRKIEVVQEDGASDWPTYAEKAQKLIVNDKVAASLSLVYIIISYNNFTPVSIE